MAKFTIKLRRGPAAEWTTDNPVLSNGEPGFEDDTGKLKIGDGVQAWVDLEYYPPGTIVAGVASVDGRTGTVTLADLYAALAHGHAQSDVTGLVSALAGKAATVHGHAQSDITGLAASLAGKSDTGHTHAQSDITDLVSALAGKSDTGHAHSGSDITSGTVATARLSVGTSSGTVAAGDHNHVSGPAPVNLVDGATIATDASLGNYFRVTLAGDRTLSNPTNMVDGQKCIWEFTQDGSGNQTITLGSAFIFGADLTGVTLSTAANKKDLMGAVYNSSLGKWLVIAFIKGF